MAIESPKELGSDISKSAHLANVRDDDSSRVLTPRSIDNVSVQEALARKLEEEGRLRFQRLPSQVYPEMRYATAAYLAKVTSYSAAHIQRLIQTKQISGLRIAGRWVADPI